MPEGHFSVCIPGSQPVSPLSLHISCGMRLPSILPQYGGAEEAEFGGCVQISCWRQGSQGEGKKAEEQKTYENPDCGKEESEWKNTWAQAGKICLVNPACHSDSDALVLLGLRRDLRSAARIQPLLGKEHLGIRN